MAFSSRCVSARVCRQSASVVLGHGQNDVPAVAAAARPAVSRPLRSPRPEQVSSPELLRETFHEPISEFIIIGLNSAEVITADISYRSSRPFFIENSVHEKYKSTSVQCQRERYLFGLTSRYLYDILL